MQESLQKIHALLDELIEIARSLVLLSNEVASEDEINALQVEQEQIIQELMRLDEELHREFPELAKEGSPEKMAIHEKMTEFQKLNRRFIENLERGSGLIKFE